MHQTPDLWRERDRIQWGCVLMQLLGETSLRHLHLLLTGMRSIERSRQASAFIPAIHTARMILNDLLTYHAVQTAVYDFQEEGEHGSFRIDAKTLEFSPLYESGIDSQVAKAEEVLMGGLAHQPDNRPVANADHDLTAEIDKDKRVPFRLHGLSFPTIQKHSIVDRPRQPIQVKVAELTALAQELDREDREAGRSSLAWTQRVKARLQVTEDAGLRDADVLDLTGLKHLIGLPGAGKTTLITLLCVLLQRQNKRVAVFFTSIQSAQDYLEILRRYGVKVALLMGRAGSTHLRHANRMAEMIAGDGGGGFARTRTGAELFATSCPLPAFADSWPSEWALGDAPCEKIYEADSSSVERLCPVWERCGRVKNQRELVRADVWLGHVLSADTYVPRHTSSERLRYFEYIAQTFDLLIFDECDETQKVLDQDGALTLQITGSDDSIHSEIRRMTARLAENTVRVSDGLLVYLLQANEFERHTLRFLAEVRRLWADRRTQKIAKGYADRLLTANFLLRETLRAAKTYEQFNGQALSALSDFWERALYRAFFFRGETEEGWPKAEKYAAALSLSVDELNKHWLRLNALLKRYLALSHAAAANEIFDQITEALCPLLRTEDLDLVRNHVRLLTVVGFTVASYQQLARSAKPLARRGEMPGDLFFSKASPEIRQRVPRSILGTFSAIRYRRSPEDAGDGKSYEIDYLVIDTTPRLLMHRLHEMGRVNVLLASATSWMQDSSAYHVEKKPDYVLSPRQNDAGRVRLHCLPLPHPATKKPLIFSGAGFDREDNLRHMVTALTQIDPEGVTVLSEVERAVRAAVTEQGRHRKAALVVNSYDQVRLVVEQIADINHRLGQRTRGVVRELPRVARERYVLKGQVEGLGQDDAVDVVVLPIAALGRGVNIVFDTEDADHGKAAVGTVYFLTRPHPAAGDLSLMISLLAQATHSFDQKDLRQASLAEAQTIYNEERFRVYRRVANLLARPMSASQLDELTLVNFAANLLVPILQMIGRGMRKQMPVEVYFVDAAWAPKSAEGLPETERSSLLVVMQRVLENCLNHSEPAMREIYQALYGVFGKAWSDIDGLIAPNDTSFSEEPQFDPSVVTPEADFDRYDPDAFPEWNGSSEHED